MHRIRNEFPRPPSASYPTLEVIFINDIAAIEIRLKKEMQRLKKIMAKVPDDKKQMASNVARRIAFMQITLEDLERDMLENGYTELFSQQKDIQYDRERPAVRIYNATIKNYAAACKQLVDLIPDSSAAQETDELMQVVKSWTRK
jgi:proline dehydrogenase